MKNVKGSIKGDIKLQNESLLNFKILLCQKITMKVISSHCSSLANDNSNIHFVVTKLYFAL